MSTSKQTSYDVHIQEHLIRVLHQLWPYMHEVDWCRWDTNNPLFANLSQSFVCLLKAHRNLNIFREEEDGSSRDNMISWMESFCESLRKKVDRGLDRSEELEDSGSSGNSEDLEDRESSRDSGEFGDSESSNDFEE